ncbi:MAG TPA: ribulose-phosphate 3-epimerase [Deltaproteobacteria bacterium]|nr:ribulose-phosphate 3-epimerase [Deltaproteobacteria bacterium]
MKKIAPSILSADFTVLADELTAVETAKADYIHIDVMDGRFVPNITIGPFVVEAVRRATTLPLDVHLMIEEPERYAGAFAKAGADIITIHVEATAHLHKAVQAVKEQGVSAGVAVNPGTPLSAVEEIIGYADLLLVMSVNPGFSGQDFIEPVLQKVARAREMLDGRGLKAELEVDGGIKLGNIKAVSDAGADVFVAGSAVFGSDDYKKTIRAMKKEITPRR